MLHKQRKNYESLSVDYSKQRTEKLEKEVCMHVWDMIMFLWGQNFLWYASVDMSGGGFENFPHKKKR